MPGGRKSEYNFEIAREICEKIATSSMGVKKLCKENPHFPHPDTIYKWIMNNKEFADLYTRAKRNQVEVYVDELVLIAEDSTADHYIDDEGKMAVDHEHINRDRMRIDTRKWIAAKLAPRIYGDQAAIRELSDEIEELKRLLKEKGNVKADSSEAKENS